MSPVRRRSALPSGAWPIFLVRSLPPGEGGFHLDRHNQPYAKVIASPDDDSWTVDASHEIIEMLIDPYGNRMQTSEAIAISGNDVVDAAGTFNYLVEGCDPCEANNYAYDIAGIALSDFITPHFYDASVTPGTGVQLQGEYQAPSTAPSQRINFVCAIGRDVEPDSLGQSRRSRPNMTVRQSARTTALGGGDLSVDGRRAPRRKASSAAEARQPPESGTRQDHLHSSRRAARGRYEEALRERYILGQS